MTRFQIAPVEGKRHKDRQWGWRVLQDGVPFLDCTWGGTGPCWNIGRAARFEGDQAETEPMHICELDDLIAALAALRESDAYRLNEEQWQ